MALLLGKLPAVKPYGLLTIENYVAGKIPSPPGQVAVPTVNAWGMFDNDTVGDCTIAGAAHNILAWNAVSGVNLPVPTDATALAEYYTLTGGPDSGLVLSNVLQTWRSSGLWGNTILGYAPLSGSIASIQQSIAFYGLAYIGVALPQSAQQQFPNNPWTVVPGSPILGGHCIVLVGYNDQYVQAVTWGQVVNISYPWLQAYMDESWAIVSEEYAQATTPLPLDLASLEADLNALVNS